MSNDSPRILVMGVGNILYTDEGLGVRLVEHLEARYDFSEQVTLFDGGTLGMRLMGPIMECDLLIVLDAVLGGDEPGAIYRLTGDDLRKSLAFKNSMHQTDLVDTLIFCQLAGHCPEAVIIGMEPFDYETMHPEISPLAQERLPLMAEVALKEIAAHGGSFTPKSA
ncbi:HyaD/HybD family hydrogenase maturation endopeptidase [Megalodesulfovibrio gigas]|uniref:HynC n=1 Tax=Megalodesulfovibrio gigas (strain ATCC 19364 / DSM 1382 / NCIMB 9332 / VKM B-1759) TaxID=1121448 RepID=T2GBP7_MEGG1|nr:HyaD/HybD family hydrogenase maturation endopeptidase [Megalodesulfovibrio gigas]AGW14015.1 hynC [Megalodesulfovibrio gigas DSM 1382 = ATCC 19364]